MARTLWGTGINGNHAKPNWLTPDQADRCFASPAGWVLHRKDGTQELLVAVKGLSLAAKLGTTVIDKLTWATGTFGRSQAQTIKVRFDQQVVVTGSPTLSITTSTTPITATFSAINADKNILTFSFTTQAAATTLSVGAQSILLAGGTINELNKETSERLGTYQTGTVAANLAISAAIATAVGTKVIA
jgi:hypothetical protein